VAQPPRRSRRLQGLPPELPGLSSTDGNTDRSSTTPSLPLSNVETSLVTENASVPPSILNPGSVTSFELPDLITFAEPLVETYLFPNEGPTELFYQSNLDQLFEAYSEKLSTSERRKKQ